MKLLTQFSIPNPSKTDLAKTIKRTSKKLLSESNRVL